MAAQMGGLDIRILSITILLSLVFLSRALVDCMFAFNLINEQLNILKMKIKQLENEKGKGERHHLPHPTPIPSEPSEQKSVYLTPRQTIGDLIDLNSPPKTKSANTDNFLAPPLPRHGLPQHRLDDLRVGLDHRHSESLMDLPDMPYVNVQETMTNPPGLPPPSVSNCPPPSEPNVVVQKIAHKTKIKEADTIKLLPLPHVPQFEAWKNSLRSQVMAASGRRAKASARARWRCWSGEAASSGRADPGGCSAARATASTLSCPPSCCCTSTAASSRDVS